MPPFIRIPLLFPSAIVLHPLDVAATAAFDPPGAKYSTGYDPDFREPIVYASSGERTSSTQYKTALTLPCQVEIKPWEELQQVAAGNAALTQTVFVLHRADLSRLGLLSATTGRPTFCVNSKVTDIKTFNGVSAGVSSCSPEQPLYIVQIQPGSWGCGSTGYDLELLYTATRPAVEST